MLRFDTDISTDGQPCVYVTMTELKQQASRILDEKEPTAILRNSKVEGYYVPVESLAFATTDDARVAELTQSILDQRS